jgi:hypothetical protein
MLDAYARRSDPTLGQATSYLGGFDREHNVDLRWIVFDIETRTEADLHHSSA